LTRKLLVLYIVQLYDREEVLQMVPPCVLDSSIQQDGLNIASMLAKAFHGELEHWYAHW